MTPTSPHHAQNTPPNVVANAACWAGHMGFSSNLRYQILNGFDMVRWGGLGVIGIGLGCRTFVLCAQPGVITAREGSMPRLSSPEQQHLAVDLQPSGLFILDADTSAPHPTPHSNSLTRLRSSSSRRSPAASSAS